MRLDDNCVLWMPVRVLCVAEAWASADFHATGRDGHEREAATRLQDPGPLQRVTKATVIAFVLCTCVHADLDQDWPKLEPLQKVLDKCFLIPMHAPRQHNTEGGGARLPCNIFNSGLRHGPYIRTDGPGCVSQD